jgi:cellulose synthase/poly-beta-1,6-N-acetylglucosamine synthase-like glycosyltransferase
MAPSSANEITQHSWHLLALTYNVFRQLAPINCSQIEDSLLASIDQIDTYDMIVVGLQEVSHTELVKSTVSEFRRWNRILIDAICKRNRQLVCIGEFWLADNSLFVLIDRRLLVHIASVDPMYVRTSFYGLTGHKVVDYFSLSIIIHSFFYRVLSLFELYSITQHHHRFSLFVVILQPTFQMLNRSIVDV